MSYLLRTILTFLLITFSLFAKGEEIVCSYPNYKDGSPVLIKITIDGTEATIDKNIYKVLQNNSLGAVFVRSFSEESSHFENQIDVGLMGIVIDKKKLTMLRGNIIHGENFNTLKEGVCTI